MSYIDCPSRRLYDHESVKRSDASIAADVRGIAERAAAVVVEVTTQGLAAASDFLHPTSLRPATAKTVRKQQNRGYSKNSKTRRLLGICTIFAPICYNVLAADTHINCLPCVPIDV